MALRFNDLRLLSAKLNKQKTTLAGMIVKLVGCDVRHDLEALAIDAMGEQGLMYGDESSSKSNDSWQFNFMMYLGLIIGGGTAQIQKNIIGERALGLPREPKAAKQ